MLSIQLISMINFTYARSKPIQAPLVALAIVLSGCGNLGLESKDTGRNPLGGSTVFNETGAYTPDSEDTDDTYDTDDTEEQTPDHPTLSSFTLSSHATAGRVTVKFTVSDENADLDGGYVKLTLNGTTTTYDIPGDIDSWVGNGTSTLNISGFSPGDTVGGTMKIYDAAGHGSVTLSDQITLNGYNTTLTESGNEVGSATNLGTISIPAEISGSLSSASNSGGAYSGDMDWVKFKPQSTDTWSFSLTWSSTSSDYDMHLLNTGMSTLANAVSDGNSQPENFHYAVTSGTTYYLVVAGWSGNGGSYTVEIQ